jgi:hypothetical protein
LATDVDAARRDSRQFGGEGFEVGAVFGFEPPDLDAFSRGLQAPRVADEASRFSGAGCGRDVDDQPGRAAEFAQELAGRAAASFLEVERRTVHGRSGFAEAEGLPRD